MDVERYIRLIEERQTIENRLEVLKKEIADMTLKCYICGKHVGNSDWSNVGMRVRYMGEVTKGGRYIAHCGLALPPIDNVSCCIECQNKGRKWVRQTEQR